MYFSPTNACCSQHNTSARRTFIFADAAPDTEHIEGKSGEAGSDAVEAPNGDAVEGEDDDDLLAESDERARARQAGQPAVLSVSASPDG